MVASAGAAETAVQGWAGARLGAAHSRGLYDNSYHRAKRENLSLRLPGAAQGYPAAACSSPCGFSPRPARSGHGVDVQANVVDYDRLPQHRQHLVHEGLMELLGELLDVWAEDDRGEELTRGLRLAWCGLQPALRRREARCAQALTGDVRGGVVPGGLPPHEVLGVGFTRENRSRLGAQPGDVALSPTLRHEPPPGTQGTVQPREESLVI